MEEEKFIKSRREERHKERQKVYNDKRWKDLRALKIKAFPLCEDCKKQGIIKPAEEVHHIKSPFVRGISLEEKERRAFDYDNTVALCKECHWRRHHPEGIMADKLLKYS